MSNAPTHSDIDGQFLIETCPTKERLFEICTEEMDYYLPPFKYCTADWLCDLV